MNHDSNCTMLVQRLRSYAIVLVLDIYPSAFEQLNLANWAKLCDMPKCVDIKEG